MAVIEEDVDKVFRVANFATLLNFIFLIKALAILKHM